MTHLRQQLDDPDLDKGVGMLWLGEAFAQLEAGFLRVEAQRERCVQPRTTQPERVHRMDRLSAVTCVMCAVIALVACEAKGAKQASVPASRTDGAKVAVGQTATTEPFCDLHATDDKAAPFHWPELAAGSTAPGTAATWRWVNVWATWCEPCIEEMPRLLAWRDKLAAAGRRVELSFVSIDDADAEVDAFRASHPGMPPSIRIADTEARAAWLGSFRLGDGAIPIHLFVSPANRLRCARAGGIREKDYEVIATLLGE